ncbi:MAG TPA: hypothetical protein VLI54_01855 [Bacillota bacterium]|nr:hypothetical protein [Bacillota bacterium]
MVSHEYFGAPINDHYGRVDRERALAMPQDTGIPITLPREALVRPFDIFYAGHQGNGYGVNMDAFADDERNVMPHLSMRSFAGVRILAPVMEHTRIVPVVSFYYYKGGEVGERVIALRGFAYGVHRMHQHTGMRNRPEAPTWYMYGRHIGTRNPWMDTVTMLEDSRQVKHFSLARIVRGPLGDPALDVGFRRRMNIPAIGTA